MEPRFHLSDVREKDLGGGSEAEAMLLLFLLFLCQGQSGAISRDPSPGTTGFVGIKRQEQGGHPFFFSFFFFPAQTRETWSSSLPILLSVGYLVLPRLGALVVS